MAARDVTALRTASRHRRPLSDARPTHAPFRCTGNQGRISHSSSSDLVSLELWGNVTPRLICACHVPPHSRRCGARPEDSPGSSVTGFSCRRRDFSAWFCRVDASRIRVGLVRTGRSPQPGQRHPQPRRQLDSTSGSSVADRRRAGAVHRHRELAPRLRHRRDARRRAPADRGAKLVGAGAHVVGRELAERPVGAADVHLLRRGSGRTSARLSVIAPPCRPPPRPGRRRSRRR